MIDLRIVFNRLKAAGIRLHPDKCRFCQKETNFLGHVVPSEGIKPDPEKIRAIMDFAAPRTLKQLRGFLGLAGYYRKFIDQFAQVATPLTDLLSKDRLFIWSRASQEAFETLQAKLCSAEVLAYPDKKLDKKLNTDASGHAISGVLVQVMEDGKERPLGYFSRVLRGAELVSFTLEGECLAIVESVKHFRPYLYG